MRLSGSPMFAHVRQLVALAYEGYTDSEGNVFSGDRGSFDITDKFSGICPAEHSLVHRRSAPMMTHALRGPRCLLT